jgi:hypothetical protein
LAALAVALAPGLVGCAPPAPSSPPGSIASVDPNDPDGDGIALSRLQKIRDAAFGVGGTPEERAARANEKLAFREESVARCMHEQGFAYTPYVMVYRGQDFVSASARLDDRDWVTQWGYGIVYFPEPAGRPAADPPADPNQAYLEGLAEPERTAYVRTLYGEDAETAEPVPIPADETEPDWEGLGCSGQAEAAWQQAHPEDRLYLSGEFTALFEAMDDFLARDNNPALGVVPGMEAAEGAWSDCLADAGYPGFSAQHQAPGSISAELRAIYDTWAGSGQRGSPESSPQYQQLADRESALALADLDCRQATGYRDSQQVALSQNEDHFIADHQSEIDALEAALAHGGLI